MNAPRESRNGRGQAEGESPAADLRSLLERELGRPVDLRYGHSRRLPVVARTPSPREARAEPRLAAGGLVVRVHAMFEGAPEGIQRDLASWLRVGRRAARASERLDRWIELALTELPPAPVRAARLVSRGRVHDLELLTRELLAGELARDYATQVPPAVTWGERRQTSARRSLRLGSYDHTAHLVRIHPVLDQPGVPAFFVRSVLFHELLHGALPVERDGAGRWIHHPPEFRRREQARPEHAAALRFERRHLGALLRSTRTGLDLVPVSAARRGPEPGRAGSRAKPAREPYPGPGLFD